MGIIRMPVHRHAKDHEMGHVNRNCPRRTSSTSAAVQQDGELEYAHPIHSVQEVGLTFLLSKEPIGQITRVVSLFDSGSPRSFINEELVPKCCIMKPMHSGYCGLGNSSLMSLGLIECRIEHSNHQITTEFIILPKQSMLWSLIIGEDAMPKLKRQSCIV